MADTLKNSLKNALKNALKNVCGSSDNQKYNSQQGDGDALKNALKNALKILEFMSDNRKITIDDLVSRLGVSRRYILNLTNALKESSIIERVGGRKSGCWKITLK
ncbi:MAG: HTH domain-containing protein [Bacteroidales bacterium]